QMPTPRAVIISTAIPTLSRRFFTGACYRPDSRGRNYFRSSPEHLWRPREPPPRCRSSSPSEIASPIQARSEFLLELGRPRGGGEGPRLFPPGQARQQFLLYHIFQDFEPRNSGRLHSCRSISLLRRAPPLRLMHVFRQARLWR